MNGQLIILIELILIAGGLITFALWEIRAVRRDKKASMGRSAIIARRKAAAIKMCEPARRERVGAECS